MSTDVSPRAGRRAPGPRGNLLLGNALQLRRAGQLAYGLENWRCFGDVVRVRLGPFAVHMVASPAHIHQVLIANRQNYGRGRGYQVLRLLTGQGLLTSEGALWQRQRRLMQPPFTPKAVPPYVGAITAATQAMLERWETQTVRRDRDVNAEMLALALDVIGRTMFSRTLDQHSRALVAAFAQAVPLVGARITAGLEVPLAVPTPANRRLRQALHTLDTRMYALIAERRRLGSSDRPDLLARLLDARDAETGAAMSLRQVRDEVMTIFFAGHETIAQTLTWVWYLLGQHPEVEERLHAELAAVLSGRAPTVADLPRLPYTHMVIAETLRLYPAVWAIPRGAVGADVIGGYAIPAGSMVFPFVYAAHRHPEVWPEPERFDPTRFAPDVSGNRPPCSYLPFGAGPRACIGQAFALQEALVVLAMVAQRDRLRLAPGQLVVPHSAITVGPRGGLRMTIHRR